MEMKENCSRLHRTETSSSFKLWKSRERRKTYMQELAPTKNRKSYTSKNWSSSIPTKKLKDRDETEENKDKFIKIYRN